MMSRSQKKAQTVYTDLTFLVAIFLILSAGIGAASPVGISVNTPSLSIEKGKDFTVNISVDPAYNSISSAQFNLIFDASVLDVKSITEGNLFKNAGVKTIFDNGTTNNSDGSLVNVWSLIISPGASVTAKGTLASITMYAKNIGTSKLNLTNVMISNTSSLSIPAGKTNLLVSVYGIDYTPPASVRSLRNITYKQRYITWRWTDPVDADFKDVMIYLNGVFKTRVKKGVKQYNASGLSPGSLYTISTKTSDSSGNINSAWVNHSARTNPDIYPPTGIRSLKNSTYAQKYINWTWTDPVDADFAKVMIYLNGVYKTTALKGVRYYNATGLRAGYLYAISTRTVDSSGNTNQTWVNHSTRTKY
ncbi:MAG: cohesin domain-containing protein [Candidatus Methanoperedens sp.]|nr:cohesin domain-containing protein [Candidatus Methanoperedens sp.]